MRSHNKSIVEVNFTLRKLSKCMYVYIGETERRGLGIFAAKHFQSNDVIVMDEDGDYYDNMLSYDEAIRSGYDIARDCFQVGADLYNPPNGNLDDMVNHSCDPTTGLRLSPKGYRMIALRDIVTGNELTYDYSTYISGARETLDCRCGAPNCRQLIGSFSDLPDAVKRHYVERDVVGEFAARPSGKPPLPDH